MENNKTIGLGLPLEQVLWSSVPLHIPNDELDYNGRITVYKTELVLFRSPERTEKINWWHTPDPRKAPHNHPWMDPDTGISFISEILHGGYTETRYTKNSLSGLWQTETITYKTGDKNEMPHDVFHTVDSVEPGTVTRMICTHTVPNGVWGYLDDNNEFVQATPDSTFLNKLKAVNPHLYLKK